MTETRELLVELENKLAKLPVVGGFSADLIRCQRIVRKIIISWEERKKKLDERSKTVIKAEVAKEKKKMTTKFKKDFAKELKKAIKEYENEQIT